MVNTLTISFLDVDTVLEPGEVLTFGRQAQICLDEGDDPYLHREAGLFIWFREMWWRENTERKIDLTVVRYNALADPQVIELQPGQESEPLTSLKGVVRLTSGPRDYEIEYVQREVPAPPRTSEQPVDGTVTEDFGVVALGENQRLLLAALAEPFLMNPGKEVTMPTNKAVMQRLDWTLTTYNRRLDGLCLRFAQRGVKGLVGTGTSKAQHRRKNLVDHVIRKRMITSDDLIDLPSSAT